MAWIRCAFAMFLPTPILSTGYLNLFAKNKECTKHIEKSRNADTLGPVELIVWPEQGYQGDWRVQAGLHNLFHPSIRDGSTWSKFGARGEHGDDEDEDEDICWCLNKDIHCMFA